MSDTRFLSIIQQVFRGKIFECKFDFRQCATLKKLSIRRHTTKTWARILMDDLTVPDITVTDATIDSWMMNHQKGIRASE